MDLLLFTLGIFLVLGSMVYLIVTLIKRTFSKKTFRNLILSGVALAFIGLVIGVATADPDTASEKSIETTTKPSEKGQEEKREEEKLKAEQAKKEAEKVKKEEEEEKAAKEKAKKEAEERKRTEEAKRKEIEEAKKKEELAKKEAEKKQKQEIKQTESKTEKLEKEEVIDTSVFEKAKKIEITDAIDITQHVTVFVDIPNKNVAGQSVINVLSQTYDFLQQDDMTGAKTVTIAVRQNGIKIAQFTIDKDQFVPDDNQPMAGQVLKAAEIETLSNEVREYGSVMELW
ncbi:hypothetical protein [Pseudobacillus badius]|uniref:hypothetical protein n=1 Tax=Bacillus badius TaxID=1455 RepID=UPI0007B3C20B|nr:hypothetical protein [Bacillus badius]KZR58369.1 hypothetical protein A3781_17395 [Bacillus badius]